MYIADAMLGERSALRLMLLDLKMQIVGEAGDWSTALAEAPICRTDILIVEWELLPADAPSTALNELRRACPEALVIILIGHLEARQQAAISVGADVFISKGEMPERVAEYLRAAAAKILI